LVLVAQHSKDADDDSEEDVHEDDVDDDERACVKDKSSTIEIYVGRRKRLSLNYIADAAR
jgi:hypothetical protein